MNAIMKNKNRTNQMMKKTLLILISFTSLIACKTPETQKAMIEKESFGTTQDGRDVERYTLVNSGGMRVQILTYGGIITSLEVPNRAGKLQDVVLGYDQLSDYEKSSPYFGALIGRYGNRIANGKFSLEGTEYTLVQNNGNNHLHGGTKGFDKVVWTAEPLEQEDKVSLKLTYLSKDMEEGYPGNLSVEVLYTLTSENALEIHYLANTDKTTVVNLTQHSYFNLSGGKDILDHILQLNASGYLPVDETLIPTGIVADVTNTPFDFTQPKTIGRDIEKEDVQLKNGLGYDHCWVLNHPEIGMRTAAIVSHPTSGIQLEVQTDEPAIQFYSGNFLDGSHPMKNSDGFYAKRAGFCLETQHYPNSPNEERFPSVVVQPEETYTSKTIFKFTNK